VTSGLISLGADILCQILTAAPESNLRKRCKDIDWWRVVKFTSLGAVYTGPVLHYWYGLLARKISGVSVASALQRLAMDQLFFAPAYIAGFFSIALILDNKISEIPSKLNSDLKSSILANFSVWIPCQFINFKYVPPHLQVLWSNMVGFFWNIYLSKLTYKTSPIPEDEMRKQ
jgi:hypothetical protein